MKRNAVHMRAQRAYPKATLKQCNRCGVTKAKFHRHHADHSKPLEVEILCPKCHAKADQELGNRPVQQPKACKVCGAMFMPCHSKKHETCSAKCLSQLGRLNAEKRWKGHSRKRNCLNCGIEFEPLRSRAATCSASCGNKLAWKNRATRGQPENGQTSRE